MSFTSKGFSNDKKQKIPIMKIRDSLFYLFSNAAAAASALCFS
jgi:hypothetical protein